MIFHGLAKSSQVSHSGLIPIRFQNMGIPNAVFSCCSCFSWLKKKEAFPEL